MHFNKILAYSIKKCNLIHTNFKHYRCNKNSIDSEEHKIYNIRNLKDWNIKWDFQIKNIFKTNAY